MDKTFNLNHFVQQDSLKGAKCVTIFSRQIWLLAIDHQIERSIEIFANKQGFCNIATKKEGKEGQN